MQKFRTKILGIAVLLGATALSAVATHAAATAEWRFDDAHRQGTNFKALHGPDLMTSEPLIMGDLGDQGLALNQKSLVIADPHTKAGAVLPRENLTVSMWVSVDQGEEWGGLLGAILDNGDLERGWLLGYRGKKFSFALSSTGARKLTYLISETDFVPGRWYHVAATYDGKTMRLYIDGELAGESIEQSGPILYPEATPFVLGTFRDSDENTPMKGRILEAQIDDTALSPAQIKAQFQKRAELTTQVAPALLPPPKLLAVPSNKKVLIIGTDGTRPDLMEKIKAPNIRALIAGSTYSDTATTRMPTVSGPGWSSMLTGVWSDKHGVLNNSFVGKNYGQYPDLLTRLEGINPKFKTFAAADWPPILTSLGGGPLISDKIDVKFAFRGDLEKSDATIADMSSDYLRREDVDVAYVYLGNIDEAAHAHGAISPQYTKALEELDGYVGQLVKAVRSRPNYAQEDWLILMSTDHGHRDKGGHGGPSAIERGIFFLANGPSVDKKNLKEPVEIVDVGVTALAHLGVKINPSWNLDGKVQALKTP